MNIQQLIETGGNITVAVSPVDLKEFALSLIAEVRREEEQRRQEQEVYLTPKETAEKIGVTENTLWRWNKNGYLMPFKIGSKSRYRLSDIERVMTGGAKEKRASTTNCETL